MTHIKTATSSNSRNWNAFADTLRRERRTRGLTQSQAAAAAGMGSAQAWSWYERGKSARRSTIEILEHALGITDESLLIAAGFIEAPIQNVISTNLADDIDSLTRLANLQGFYKRRDKEFLRVTTEWKMCSDPPLPLSLVMFEIGSFNALVANRYGQKVAEAVLQEIARILRRRAQGRFVARMVLPQQQPFDFDHRYERDFGVILPDTSREEAEAFALDCKKRIQEHSWADIVKSVQNSSNLSKRYMRADPSKIVVPMPFGFATLEEKNGCMTADSPDDLFQQVLMNLDEYKYRVLVRQVMDQVMDQVASLLPSEMRQYLPADEMRKKIAVKSLNNDELITATPVQPSDANINRN